MLDGVNISALFRFSILSVLHRALLASAGISCHRVSVCLSVRLSQVGVLLKRLNVGSRKQRQTYFSDAENLGKTQTGSPPTKALKAGGVPA